MNIADNIYKGVFRMLKKVAFTMYPVLDINRAKSFYEKNLGLTPSKISSNGSWIEYDLPGGGCFAITTLAEGVKPSASSGGSIAFEVEDLDALVKQLKTNDVKFKLDIFTSPVCRMAVIVDSEGNAVSLHQLKNK
jgi:predicted enzyme related to lactoylglutathione lyase